MRNRELKMLRVSLDLTQEEMAHKLGIKRDVYASVENGRRKGTVDFWLNIQSVCGISAEHTLRLMKNG